MPRLSEILKKQAKTTATENGHKLGKFAAQEVSHNDDEKYVATCTECGAAAVVFIDEANHSVTGLAVKYRCGELSVAEQYDKADSEDALAQETQAEQPAGGESEAAVPSCIAFRGCACAGHARGTPATYPCNTSERVKLVALGEERYLLDDAPVTIEHETDAEITFQYADGTYCTIPDADIDFTDLTVTVAVTAFEDHLAACKECVKGYRYCGVGHDLEAQAMASRTAIDTETDAAPSSTTDLNATTYSDKDPAYMKAVAETEKRIKDGLKASVTPQKTVDRHGLTRNQRRNQRKRDAKRLREQRQLQAKARR